jgi:8-oxo-dGTP diphosphatase
MSDTFRKVAYNSGVFFKNLSFIVDNLMPQIEISENVWQEYNALRERFNFPTEDAFLEFCLDVAQTRYCPAVGAIVTRDDREILMVGNDYGLDELTWNLPGGAVDPGEDLLKAVVRELYEETGITALEIGSLAWIVQGVLEQDQPFIIALAFEISTWEGDVSVENEVEHGDVQQAKFVPYADALERMISGNRDAFRDWLAGSNEKPHFYFATPEETRKVK